MWRNPKPSPKGLVRPDYATWHGAQAGFYLMITAVLGATMAFTPPGAWKIGAAMVYGVFGLLGFLAQLVIGVGARLLPTFAWMHAYVASDFEIVPPSQYTMHRRAVQLAGFGLWSLGVPLLAAGLYRDAWWMISGSGAVLFGALVCNAYNAVRIVRHAFAD